MFFRIRQLLFISNLMIFLVLGIITAVSYYFDLSSSYKVQVDRAEGIMLSVFSDTIKQDILLGTGSEVNRKCARFATKEMVAGVRVTNGQTKKIICGKGEFGKSNTSSKSTKIYFSEAKSVVAAEVSVYFESHGVSPLNSFSRTAILIAATILVAFMASLIISTRITKPITSLASLMHNYRDGIEKGALPQGTKIREIFQLTRSLEEMMLDIDHYKSDIEEKSKSVAIAKTTQMLAHDVRKPFSMLQGIIALINNSNSLGEMKSIVAQADAEISGAIRSVNGMIQDVMEIGSEANIIPEVVNPESIIESTITDTFRYLEGADIEFEFDLQSKLRLNVDVLKVSRVFNNIMNNAAQAMKCKGKIWIRTVDVGSGYTKVTIGNNNSYIASDDLGKLFESFFTSNKKGGTGLGLAIAKKVIKNHGGEIWCTSSREDGTEFHFTLPNLPMQSSYDGALPMHSKDVRLIQFDNIKGVVPVGTSEKNELLLEKSIIHESKKLGLKISILLVDDEHLYLTILKNQLAINPDLAECFQIREAASGESALELLAERKSDIVVLDVDMGAGNLTGFETSQKIRDTGNSSIICIHSNRSGSENYKRAIESGAEIFISKTMPREHFLRLIYSYFEDPDHLLKRNVEESESSVNAKFIQKIVLIDDEEFVHSMWKEFVREDKLERFYSYDELKKAITSNKLKTEDVWAIVSDYRLGDHQDGFDVANLVKEHQISVPVFLSSNDTIDIAGTPIVAKVSKVPPKAINAIQDYYETNSTSRDIQVETLFSRLLNLRNDFNMGVDKTLKKGLSVDLINLLKDAFVSEYKLVSDFCQRTGLSIILLKADVGFIDPELFAKNWSRFRHDLRALMTILECRQLNKMNSDSNNKKLIEAFERNNRYWVEFIEKISATSITCRPKGVHEKEPMSGNLRVFLKVDQKEMEHKIIELLTAKIPEIEFCDTAPPSCSAIITDDLELASDGLYGNRPLLHVTPGIEGKLMTRVSYLVDMLQKFRPSRLN